MESRTFSTSLAAQPAYRLGEPITITFQIDNNSGETYQLLTWGTPLESELTGDCFIVRRDGEVLPYDGKLVKRGDPPQEAYVIIESGQTLQQVVDISRVYPIDTAGDYTVTLNAAFLDAFPIAESSKQAPRKRQNHQSFKLVDSTVAFKVIADGEPKLTTGQAERKASPKQAKSNAKAPNFNGGTSTQQAETIIAHGNAQYFAALAAAQLSAGPASTNALYQTWFGAFDQGRYDSVTKHYNDISNTLLNEQVTYDFTGKSAAGDTCKPGDFAFTYKGSRTVYLCSSYLSAAQIGTDCKFGTLVHEWSHAVSSTDDNAYGQSACRTLATTDTSKAINNADSHEYFAEELAQSNFGKSFTLITDRSTFGKDEIDALLLQGSPAVITKAFYVVADGFWPDKLGITSASLGASPGVKPSITISPSVPGMAVTVTELKAEDINLPIFPQRFTWVCRISFSNSNGFPTNPGGVLTVTLTATLGGLSNSAQIQLIREPNPYELDGETSWLSTDVRVFQIRAGDSRFGATIGSTPADASTFIKQVIANLNAGNAGGQTFDSLSTDPQTSVLELAQKVNGTNVFNFAIAKVRYRGTLDISNVRVFFRLFPAATTSVNYNLTTTYRRATQGGTTIPLPGLSASGDLLTIPCFAEPRVNSASASVTTQTDPANVRTITHGAGGSESAAYFGCWLDINQTQPQFPSTLSPANGPWTSGRKSLQELMRNAHQCLVAEIAFDPAPIPGGASPGASDKLAQRNLAIVESANPGYVASRRILTTFDLHPIATNPQFHTPPDELMIEWGNTPLDSIATIYIPEIKANQIIALAGERYINHPIVQVDEQTIQLPVGGISYVPLPAGASFGLTGLLSVELPDTVRKGEVYTILIRQVSDGGVGRVIAPPVEQPPVAELASLAEISTRGEIHTIRWRKIVGSYQITIPVRTKAVMLPRETRLLSVLRWILKSIPNDDRWYPVFSRYVGLIGERVDALGGDATTIEASPTGESSQSGEELTAEHDRTNHYDGKVGGIIYDCYGDFEGFILDACGEETIFKAREHRIEMLVLAAWRKRIAITVMVKTANPYHPISIILRHAPEPFQD